MKKSLLLGLILILALFVFISCVPTQGQGQGPQGEKGEDGVGIASIELIDSNQNVDIYQINYTNGTSTTFTVTNGMNGSNGQDGVGIANAAVNGEGELVLSFTNGETLSLGKVVGAKGEDGKNGTDGVGIANVALNGNNLVITLTNGTVIDLGNIKGADGKDGVNGEDGKDGVDGVSVIRSEINAKGELVLYYSNNTSTNLGKVVGSNGTNGSNGSNGVDGEDGVGIQTVKVDENGNLSVTLTTGVTLNLGNIKGPQGDKGDNGLDGVSVVDAEINNDGELIFTLSNGEKINVGKIIGSDGINGVDGVGIKGIAFNANGELIITLTDNSTINCGKVPTCSHTYSSWSTVSEANCTSMGVKVRTCSKCGFEDYDFVSSLGHNYKNTVVSATCTEKGYTLHECSKCDYEYRDTYTAKTAHSYGTWTEMLSTCTTKVLCQSCTVCGSTAMKSESGSWHNYTTSVVAPTCSEQGYTLHSCTSCGNNYKDTFADATGTHSWQDLYTIISTCAERRILRTCTICNINTVVEETPMEIHKYLDDECSVCGNKRYTSIGLEYELNYDGKSYAVCGIGTCSDSEISIPSVFNNKPVTTIKEEAFYGCTNITGLYIPDTVVIIENNALRGCSNLINIRMSNNIIDTMGIFFTEGDNSVSRNANYTEYKDGYYIGNELNPYLILAKINNNVTTLSVHKDTKIIAPWAFSTNLTSISIPDGILEITPFTSNQTYNFTFTTYDNALYIGNEENPYVLLFKALNKSITSCNIHEDTKIIFDSAFSGCSELTEIYIPDSVRSLGQYAFYGCKKLLNVTLTQNSNLFKIGNRAFFDCFDLKSFSLVNKLEIIDELAFGYCYDLNSFTISSSVKSIRRSAFFRTSNLKFFEVSTENAFFCAVDGNLLNKDKTILIEYAAGKSESVFVVPSTVKYIYGDITYANFKEIILPNSLKDIEDFYFYQESSLNYYEYDNGLYLGNEDNNFLVFVTTKDKNILNCTIHPSTKFIMGAAFMDCTKLEAVSIPQGIISIGARAFQGCKSLKSVVIPEGVTRLGEGLFQGCSSLSYLSLPRTILKIRNMDHISGQYSPCLSSYSNTSLTEIIFSGTIEEWNAIEDIYKFTGSEVCFRIKCSNGYIN